MSAARKAVSQIRTKAEAASCHGVHIYSFNVPPAQLPNAYALLDKQDQRKSMRVTSNSNHNFVVRHVPGRVHNETIESWNEVFKHSLRGLTLAPELSAPGIAAIGKTTFRLGERNLEPDGGIGPSTSKYPSIVLEVGDTESLVQLEIDAKLWIEHLPVQLVVLICIDSPRPPFPNFPTISIQLWKPFPVPHPLCTEAAQQRQAHKVWEADWTEQATPLYILLSDIFGAQVPAEYGDNDRAVLNSQLLRQQILDSYSRRASE